MSETINKKGLIDAVADKLGTSKKQVGEFVDVLLDEVTSALGEGKTVDLSGFGKFEVRERAARDGFNPQTKEKIRIEASKSVAFKASKALKDSVK